MEIQSEAEGKREFAATEGSSVLPVPIREIAKNKTIRYNGNAKEGYTVITVVENRCKGCDICVKVCPQNVLKLAGPEENFVVKVINLSACDKCMRCEIVCPDFAIYID